MSYLKRGITDEKIPTSISRWVPVSTLEVTFIFKWVVLSIWDAQISVFLEMNII